MASNNQSVVISGAIEAPSANENTTQRIGAQPRQPTSLQGLLKFAMESTKNEDVGGSDSKCLPIDEERKKFLEDALKSMTVDIIELLQKSVKILLNADQLSEDDCTSAHVTALETILEHVDMIDTAIDFHKIGGFMIFHPCLASKSPTIRSMACNILAECCQNNPYCQNIIIDSDLLELLLSLLDRDCDITVKIKSLYAISCTIRENQEAVQQFLDLQGLKTVKSALKVPSEKLRIKAAFLLGSIATDANIRDSLVTMDTVPLLRELIVEPRTSAHEHLLSLLWLLVQDNQVAIDICCHSDLGMKNVLLTHLKRIEGSDELTEERNYCQMLLKILNEIDNVDSMDSER